MAATSGNQESPPGSARKRASGVTAMSLFSLRCLFLITVVISGCFPTRCEALKSLVSESEGKHKVRAVVEAAVRTFEAQVAAAQTRLTDDEYTMARALLER